MMPWCLKGSVREQLERESVTAIRLPVGLNTWEEAQHIAASSTVGETVHVVTSSYHVARAYLTLQAAFRALGKSVVIHVLGVGEMTNLHAQSEAGKLVVAQARGHALQWEDL